MLRTMIDNWWLFALRGSLALLFAMIAFSFRDGAEPPFFQAFTFAILIIILSLLAFTAGIFTAAAGIRAGRKHRQGWLLLLDGVGVCGAGLIALLSPKISFPLLMRIIAVWALFVGFAEITIARGLRRHLRDEWFLLLAEEVIE